MVLGGLIYNTYLCAKYGVKIAGVEVCILFPSSLRCVSVELVCCFTYFMYFFVQDSDIELAKELVEQDKMHKKILEMQVLVGSDTLDGRFEGKFRMIDIKVYDTEFFTGINRTVKVDISISYDVI